MYTDPKHIQSKYSRTHLKRKCCFKVDAVSCHGDLMSRAALGIEESFTCFRGGIPCLGGVLVFLLKRCKATVLPVYNLFKLTALLLIMMLIKDILLRFTIIPQKDL